MITLESNIKNTYGQKGIEWLRKLPTFVINISTKLSLRDLKPVSNLTYNYVAKGFQGDRPIVLKLSFDTNIIKSEALALRYFQNHGVVNVIFEGCGLLLLEAAVPGVTLKSYFPTRDMESIQIACNLMHRLHKASVSNQYSEYNFIHTKDWLSALDKNCNIPSTYLQQARKLRDDLLATSNYEIILHGDLHHDNILQNGNEWIAVDPNVMIGEPAYEIATFIRNPIPELLNHSNTQNIIYNRITNIANMLKLPARRILDWCFIQTIFDWNWALTDNLDTKNLKQLTEHLMCINI